MDYDFSIENSGLTIFGSKSLENFSNEFITYYNENIELIKEKLALNKKINLVVALTDDDNLANFVYGKSVFSGLQSSAGNNLFLP